MTIYGFIIGISLVVLINNIDKNNRKFQIIPNTKINIFIILLLIFVLFGARTYHVLDYWDYYSQNLLEISNLRGGGLGIFGGLLGGAVYIVIVSQYLRLNIIEVLNLLTPALPLTQSIARWGNYFNREIYSPTGQPLWLYESISCFILYLLIRTYPKNPTAKYLIGYGLIRLTLDSLRIDTWSINGLKISQLLSIVFIVLGVLLILWRKRKIPLTPSSGSSV